MFWFAAPPSPAPNFNVINKEKKWWASVREALKGKAMKLTSEWISNAPNAQEFKKLQGLWKWKMNDLNYQV